MVSATSYVYFIDVACVFFFLSIDGAQRTMSLCTEQYSCTAEGSCAKGQGGIETSTGIIIVPFLSIVTSTGITIVTSTGIIPL